MKYVILLIVLFIIGCTDDSASRKALEAQGFTNIELTGYSPFSCGKEDTFNTGFRATNPAGNRVEGTVCCGLLKNCTIRW